MTAGRAVRSQLSQRHREAALARSSANVLFLAPFPTRGRFAGGITTVACGVRDNLDVARRNGCSITFLNTEPGERSFAGKGKLNLENVFAAAQLVRRVRHALRGERFDVMYVPSSFRLALLKDLVAIGATTRSGSQRRVLHIHYADTANILFRSRIVNRTAVALMRRWVDDVIFLSTQTREQFVELGLPRERTHVVYNFQHTSVDPALVDAKIDSVRSGRRVEILFMGSIDRRKGVLDLLEALACLDRRDFHLNVCGTINDAGIEAEISRLLPALDGLVTMHGYVTGDAKEALLRSADLFVLPSHGEGLPMALLEAMAMGCGVVSTTVGAIPEIVVDGRNGVLVAPGDRARLAGAVRTLLGDRSALAGHMRANREKAGEFSVERFISSLCTIFRGKGADEYA